MLRYILVILVLIILVVGMIYLADYQNKLLQSEQPPTILVVSPTILVSPTPEKTMSLTPSVNTIPAINISPTRKPERDLQWQQP